MNNRRDPYKHRSKLTATLVIIRSRTEWVNEQLDDVIVSLEWSNARVTEPLMTQLVTVKAKVESILELIAAEAGEQ